MTSVTLVRGEENMSIRGIAILAGVLTVPASPAASDVYTIGTLPPLCSFLEQTQSRPDGTLWYRYDGGA
jgi:hypothetical protein